MGTFAQQTSSGLTSWGSPEGLRVLVVAAGNSHNAQHASTFVLCENSGQIIGIECPHPAHHLIATAATPHGLHIGAPDVDAWYISHIHADHASGLESVAFHRWYVQNTYTQVIAHPDVAGPLAEIHDLSALGSQTDLEGDPQPLDVADVYRADCPTPERPVVSGPFTVEIFPAVHVVPTFAVRVSAGGRSFAYSADTVLNVPLLHWLAEATMFAHDSSGGPIHADVAQLSDHLSAEDRARCLLLHRCEMTVEQEQSARAAGLVLPAAGALYSL
jgi:ribonuclease BN (tRNA processing enzyme)